MYGIRRLTFRMKSLRSLENERITDGGPSLQISYIDSSLTFLWGHCTFTLRSLQIGSINVRSIHVCFEKVFTLVQVALSQFAFELRLCKQASGVTLPPGSP